MKKIILLVLIIVVFILSSENAKNSNIRSYRFLEGSIGQVYNIDSDNKDELNYLIRKFAHFSIYFLIGLSTFSCVSDKNKKSKKQLFLSLFLVFIFALFDEVHQIYTGRCFSYKDILIDFSGGLLAIIIYYYFKNKNNLLIF